jgi:beta-N-acetylhexosaminidase
MYLYQLSRSAASPQSSAATTQADPALKYLDQLTTRQKVASLLMLHIAGTDKQKIADFVRQYQPGGLILMGDNISAEIDQVTSLTSTAQAASKTYPLFIAIDEEGCAVKRIPQDGYACAKDLGPEPISATTEAFEQRSKLLKRAGINLNFGIVADITADSQAFIYPRVFGSNPEEVGERVAAAVKASQPTVLATVKHFPGHGQTEADSHKTIPEVNIRKKDWLNQAAIPFMAGINAGTDAVMFGHLVYSQVDTQPASLSKEWHRILREELKFNGLSVTDDLIMLQQSGDESYRDVIANAIASINAGNDITLLVNDHNVSQQPQTQVDIDALLDGLVAAVDDGQIQKSTLQTLVLKNLEWRSKLKN